MKAKCISDNRDLILHVLQKETGELPIYHSLPDFSFTVGDYTLRRDGWIETNTTDPHVITVLTSLGLCESPRLQIPPEHDVFTYPMHPHTGLTLLNLVRILSARQRLLNRALDARGAFAIASDLMSDLLYHPPTTAAEFLQKLYRRDSECRGVEFTPSTVTLSGFRKGHPEETHIHMQLADRILAAALNQQWAKAFTRRVRNQKYAFRIWLNSIGMTGPDYEEARQVLLDRLPGKSDRRTLPVRKVEESDCRVLANEKSEREEVSPSAPTQLPVGKEV